MHNSSLTEFGRHHISMLHKKLVIQTLTRSDFVLMDARRSGGRKVAILCSAAFSLLLTLLAGTKVQADQGFNFQKVVLSGEPATGVAGGLTFGGFGYPLIDNAGRVAFRGYLSGMGIDSTNNEGLWHGAANSLDLVVREGIEAPLVESGTRMRLLGPLYLLGSDGTVVFNGAMEGPNMPSSGSIGMWGWKSNNIRLVARSGTLAPGLDDGERLRSISTTKFSVASDGSASFWSALGNPPGTPYFEHDSIWAEHGGTPELLAREGDAVPEVAPGATLFGLSFINSSRNGAPARIFHGQMKGGILGGNADFGLWVESNSSMSLVAYTGMPAPGFQDGRLLGNILSSGFALNGSGETAFTGFAAGPNGTPNSYMVYAGSAGALRFIAQDGDQAPGTSPGVHFDAMYSSNFQALPISESGRTAFKTSLAGPGVNSLTNSRAVYSEGFGTLELVARAGNQAPGAPDGALFDRFNTIDMLASGQLIFGASLRGAGVTTSNGDGIWIQNPTGELTKLIRQGDVLEIGPGDFRTVAYLNFAFGSAINEQGDLAIEVSFTDSTSGIFVTRAPEPTVVVLLASGLSLIRRQRRTHNHLRHNLLRRRLVA